MSGGARDGAASGARERDVQGPVQLAEWPTEHGQAADGGEGARSAQAEDEYYYSYDGEDEVIPAALGGAAARLDPVAFGFVDVVSAGEPVAPQFGDRMWLTPGGCWLARPAGGVPPLIGVDVRAPFVALVVDRKAPRTLAAGVVARASEGAGRLRDEGASQTVPVRLVAGRAERVTIPGISGAVSAIAVEFDIDTNVRHRLARLSCLEVEGRFVAP